MQSGFPIDTQSVRLTSLVASEMRCLRGLLEELSKLYRKCRCESFNKVVTREGSRGYSANHIVLQEILRLAL